jgi:hypothetical protein
VDLESKLILRQEGDKGKAREGLEGGDVGPVPLQAFDGGGGFFFGLGVVDVDGYAVDVADVGVYWVALGKVRMGEREEGRMKRGERREEGLDPLYTPIKRGSPTELVGKEREGREKSHLGNFPK